MERNRACRVGAWPLALLLLLVVVGGPMVTATVAEAAERSSTASATVASSTVLRRGMSGPEVRKLQERLVGLNYWLGTVDGSFGPLTEQAVYAFQKVNGLTRDGIVGPRTRAALANPVRPRPQSRSGEVFEVDRGTQVLLRVRDGRVHRIINVSTGKPGTVTPRGHYTVYRHIDGWRDAPLGRLYRPKYFHGGYAVHGSTSIPPYPASAGCVRVSLRAMDYLWSRMPIGTKLWVY